MRIHHLPGTDLAISDIGLGTMTFGEQTDEACVHAQLDHALAEGINLFDMAEMYPVPGRAETQGATETIVGQWLARQARDRVVIATKVAGPSRGFHWIRGGPLALDLANMRAALEASLKRLRTDYVDLYQIHWPSRPLPIFGGTQYEARDTADRAEEIDEQLQALATLVREGKVRYIGLSNETPWGTLRFLDAAQRLGLPRIVTIQNAYNLLNRTFESGLSEVCHRERLGLLAYSPLAFGLLTGKYQTHGSDPQARLNRFPEFGPRYRKAAIEPAMEGYARIAENFGLSLGALALGFVRSRFFTASTLLGARTLAQLKEDIMHAKVVLSPEALAAIEEIHLRSPNPAP